jgi:hypothetical protein
LYQAGVDAFLAAFKQMNKGTVRFMSSRGWNLPIHAALTVPTEKGNYESAPKIFPQVQEVIKKTPGS